MEEAERYMRRWYACRKALRDLLDELQKKDLLKLIDRKVSGDVIWEAAESTDDLPVVPWEEYE